MAAITSVKTDVIFLSDVRVVNSCGVRNDMRVAGAFKDAKNKSYSMFWNSSKNSRGTAILIGNNLDFEPIRDVKDIEENFLLIKVRIGSQSIILGAVYGPNGTDGEFFTRLSEGLNLLQEGGARR